MNLFRSFICISLGILLFSGAGLAAEPAEVEKFVKARIDIGEMMMNYRDVVRNVMAREKALYEGHAVAAVAATSAAIARRALKLIDVTYEVLPHVIDVVDAMRPDAPLLHEDLYTMGVEPRPERPSNVAKRVEITLGDVEAGFAKADVVVEREFRTAPVHQGYIEPHAALATVSEDGSAEVWCCTQGHYIVRAHCARLLGLDIAKVRVTASEIGGGFGGKTVVYLEPVAIRLSQKAGKPVKMVMSREEVFRASGPTSGASVSVKIGATRDGRIVAGDCTLRFQSGAFPGSPVGQAAMCAFACYDIDNARVIGYDVVSFTAKSDVSPLQPFLERKLTLLVGQSGVGKSRTVNALVMSDVARVGELQLVDVIRARAAVEAVARARPHRTPPGAEAGGSKQGGGAPTPPCFLSRAAEDGDASSRPACRPRSSGGPGSACGDAVGSTSAVTIRAPLSSSPSNGSPVSTLMPAITSESPSFTRADPLAFFMTSTSISSGLCSVKSLSSSLLPLASESSIACLRRCSTIMVDLFDELIVMPPPSLRFHCQSTFA